METPRLFLEATAVGRKKPGGGAAWLLRGVSLEVRTGDRIALVGPSGAGKTLLLRALALIDPLDEGAIQWHGADIPTHAIPAYRRQVMYFPQRPALFEGSVESNLLRPYALHAQRGRKFDRTRILKFLEILGRLPSFLEQSSRDLSGGEAQIVALIRGLQLDPTILLLDEPTASLDDRAARAVEGLINQWLAEAPDDRALIWVSHNREQADRVATRTLVVQSVSIERTV
jgi:putative ABC transport system ATP-binding protein